MLCIIIIPLVDFYNTHGRRVRDLWSDIFIALSCDIIKY